MRKKKYYRLLKNIGVWSGIVGWTLDSRGCFKSSTSYSLLIDRNSIKVESTMLSKPNDVDMIFKTKIILDIDSRTRPPSIEIMISLLYEDYLNHNFNRVTVISFSKLQQHWREDPNIFSLKELMEIEDRLKKIKK